ncbi:hypothetical protein ACFLU6_14465 [Acidobacteriota bacterium]
MAIFVVFAEPVLLEKSIGSYGGQMVIDLKVDHPDVSVFGADSMDQLEDTHGAWCPRSGHISGDLNGDGVMDLVLGARAASGPANSRLACGELYVVFGPLALGANIDLSMSPPDVTVYGADPGDGLGGSCAIADLSGDGKADLVIGAPGGNGPNENRANCGEAFVLFGPFSAGTVIDLSTVFPDVTVYGADYEDCLADSVNVGDLTGDGNADLVLGATLADGFLNLREDAGEVHILSGPFLTNTVIDLSVSEADVVIYGADRVSLGGADYIGKVVSVGDITGDDMDDLVLGTPRADGPANLRESAGGVAAVFGPLGMGERIDFNVRPPDLIIFGADLNDWLGLSVDIGDVSADGIGDLVLSTAGADGPSNARIDAGEIHVLFGPVTTGTSLDLRFVSLDLMVYGRVEQDCLGASVAVGDLTGDDNNDLVMGSSCFGPFADRVNAGEVYVLPGPFNRGIERDLALRPSSYAIYGAEYCDFLSSNVGVGDVTGDGTGDLIIGAYRADGPFNLREDCGEVYVMFSGNYPPVARAGGPYDTMCDSATVEVQLDGTSSYDPNKDPLLFSWQTDCTGAVFSDASVADPRLIFLNPVAIGCTVTVTVTDDKGLWDQELATVTVRFPEAPPDIGNRLYLTKDAGRPELSWQDYPAPVLVTHYHVRRSDLKSIAPPDPSAQPQGKSWTDSSPMEPLCFYDVLAAVDCDGMESVD